MQGGLSNRVAQVVAVGADAEEAGVLAAGLIEEVGAVVSDRHVADPDEAARLVGTIAARGGTHLVVVITPDVRVAAQIASVVTTRLRGLEAVFATRRFDTSGPAALAEVCVAGWAGAGVVIALPPNELALRTGIVDLVLPGLDALLGEASRGSAAPAAQPAASSARAGGSSPPPRASSSPSETHVGQRGFTVGAEQTGMGTAPGDEDTGLPRPGWLRAIHDLGGEILRDRREELPNDLEAISPVVDVLHTAGETAVWKRGRNKMSLWGWPDLRRPTSRVLAIGWGQPLAEVVALHRHPTKTGTCIVEDRALVYDRSTSVAEVCERVTGRAPKDDSGELFAVQGDTVWIQRGNRVIRWDGKREVDDGTPKQVISTLVLHWSNR